MLTQRNELIRVLSENGWQVVETLDADLDWWADEILIIESVWAPQGLHGYLTFLVDPNWNNHRKKGEHVWSVALSTEFPDSRSANSGPQLWLGQGWKQRLPEFIPQVNALREKDAAV